MSVQTWQDEDGFNWVSCDVLVVGDYGGAGSVGEANIRALQKDLTDDQTYLRYGAYYSKQLWLINNDDNREIVRALDENYPLYDDEEHSRVEDEWEQEAWDDYGAPDMLREIRDLCREAAEVGMDHMTADQCKQVYWDCRSGDAGKGDYTPTTEYNGSCLRLREMAADYADRVERIYWTHVRAELAYAGQVDENDLPGCLMSTDHAEEMGKDDLAAFLRTWANEHATDDARVEADSQEAE